MTSVEKYISVAAAIFYKEGRILSAKRSPHKSQGGMWEFPGGKISAQESPEQALKRELFEELGLICEIGNFIGTSKHKYENIAVELHAFEVVDFHGEISLQDHTEIKWIPFETDVNLDWAEADIPLIEKYRHYRGTLNYYDREAFDYVSKTQLFLPEGDCQKFIDYLQDEPCILDLGCGSGNASKYFHDNGLQVLACDQSKPVCELLKHRTAIPVRHCSFEEALRGNKYDGIWASASLLHLNPDQLRKVLTEIASALSDNGILYASFKQGDGEYIDNDGRYFYLQKQDSLTQMFKDITGFEILETNVQADLQGRSDTDWISFFLKNNVPN